MDQIVSLYDNLSSSAMQSNQHRCGGTDRQMESISPFRKPLQLNLRIDQVFPWHSQGSGDTECSQLINGKLTKPNHRLGQLWNFFKAIIISRRGYATWTRSLPSIFPTFLQYFQKISVLVFFKRLRKIYATIFHMKLTDQTLTSSSQFFFSALIFRLLYEINLKTNVSFCIFTHGHCFLMLHARFIQTLSYY